MEGGVTYTQVFDAENRLVSVTADDQTTQFNYNGDGNMVKKINPDGSSTIYIGSVYEVEKGTEGTVTGTTTYYPAAGAMRADGTLYYVLGDQLGSASVVLDENGDTVGETRYTPFGEERVATGSMYTDRMYTGQREVADIGLYFYNARFYDPGLGRFISPDSIVPGAGNPQAWNRYSYALNNPIRFSDPTGHCVDGVTTIFCVFVAAMVGGAILGGAVSAITQYHETGSVDMGKVATAGLEGALIGGGIVLTLGAAISVALTIGGAIEGANAACGRNMCANEDQDVSQTVIRMLDPYDEAVQTAANNVLSDPIIQNTYNVVGHGDPYSREGIGGTSLSANDLADMIQSDAAYKPGTTICLVSCSTGAEPDGFSQQLANIMQTNVYAADNEVSSVTLKVLYGGTWNLFKPMVAAK